MTLSDKDTPAPRAADSWMHRWDRSEGFTRVGLGMRRRSLACGFAAVVSLAVVVWFGIVGIVLRVRVIS